jgi:hypothetical protein
LQSPARHRGHIWKSVVMGGGFTWGKCLSGRLLSSGCLTPGMTSVPPRWPTVMAGRRPSGSRLPRRSLSARWRRHWRTERSSRSPWFGLRSRNRAGEFGGSPFPLCGTASWSGRSRVRHVRRGRIPHHLWVRGRVPRTHLAAAVGPGGPAMSAPRLVTRTPERYGREPLGGLNERKRSEIGHADRYRNNSRCVSPGGRGRGFKEDHASGRLRVRPQFRDHRRCGCAAAGPCRRRGSGTKVHGDVPVSRHRPRRSMPCPVIPSQ